MTVRVQLSTMSGCIVCVTVVISAEDDVVVLLMTYAISYIWIL